MKANEMELPVKYSSLTPSQRKAVRNEYIALQKGKCKYCRSSLTGNPGKKSRSKPVNEELFPVGFFNWPVHLHHCRKTGMTIGAVHAYCNAVLWQYHGE